MTAAYNIPNFLVKYLQTMMAGELSVKYIGNIEFKLALSDHNFTFKLLVKNNFLCVLSFFTHFVSVYKSCVSKW